jgi:hypothetical protein
MTIRIKRPRFVLACAALFLGALATGAATRATTLMRISIEKMSQTATVIVRARCLGNSTEWDTGEIRTLTSFEVEEIWKGSASGRITVQLLGGTVGNLTSRVSGVPRFRSGEEVVLFLEPTPRDDFSIVSWQQGTFRIHREPRLVRESVTQDTASLETFDAATRRFEMTGIRNLPLELLRARVEGALHPMPGRKQ